jgi:hypothetical protein
MTVGENERLARIETLLDNVTDRLKEDREYQREQNEIATKARENVKQELARLAREHELLNDWRVSKIDPFVDMGTSVKAKVTGAVLALGIIGGIIWTGLQYFKNQIMGLFGWG